jgi:hypothetical protein
MSATSTRFHEIYAQSVAEQKRAAEQAPTLEVMDRRGFLALCGAALAAAAGFALAPRAALAADATSGKITVNTSTVIIEVGQQVNINRCISVSAVPYNGDYHLDFLITSGSCGTMPKHTGIFTGTAVGTATVMVYLMAGLATTGGGNPGSLCDATKKIAEAGPITVKVNSSEDYGFQGGNITIKMTDPEPDVVSISGSTYINEIEDPLVVGGKYVFKMEMSAGFRDYDGAPAFAHRNAGNIVLRDANGSQLAALDGDNTGPLTILSASHAARTFEVGVDQGVVPGDGAVLVFLPTFRGNNDTATLNATVQFQFPSA